MKINIRKMTWEEIRAAMEAGQKFGTVEAVKPINPAQTITENTSSVITMEEGENPTENSLRPTSESQKGDDLTTIERICAVIERFVFFKRRSHYLLVAAWIIVTYLHKDFDFMGYLFAYSPEPQSGKTTLLDLLDLLVANSGGIQVSPTEATLFRTADGHTQLLDEVDSWKNKDDLRSVLNAGYKKGGNVTRFDKDAKSGLKAKKFPVYGPRALAGIGVNTLDRTTRDRTFAISMVRQKKSEKRERLRIRKIGGEVEALRKAIVNWVRENHDLVVDLYHNAEFDYLEQFTDRTMDVAEPLAAVVEISFRRHPAVVKVRAELMDAIRTTRSEQHSLTTEHRLLRHLLQLTEADDPLIGNASELAAMCKNLAEPPDEYTVSRVLRNYGFKTESKRLSGNPKYRFVLGRKTLQDVVDRWAGDADDEAGENERGD